MEIINEIEFLLKKYILLNNTSHFIVGFSGGADSMLLLYYMIKLRNTYKFNLSALHINHNWRGAESDAEEKNCEDFCHKNGVTYYCEKLGKEIKHDENSARIARYEIFDKYAKKYSATAILTAHNSTDVVETFIYRLAKGMGLDGACSIPELRKTTNSSIIRPLLNVSSKDIRMDCSKLKLKYNSDSSNFDNKYKRNLIRNEILPHFQEINESYEKSVLNFIENLKSSNILIDELAEKFYKKSVKKNRLQTQKYIKYSDDIKRLVLYRYLRNNNFEPEKELIMRLMKEIENNCKKTIGRKYSVKNSQNSKKKKFFFCSESECYFLDLTEKNDKVVMYKKNFTEYIVSKEYKGQKIPKSSSKSAVVSKIGLDFPLTLRYRKDGDVIQPFSHTSTIKLKDYFIDKKIPLHKRDSVPLLCKNNEVLWAIGVGISEKLRANTDCNNECVVLKYRQEE